MLVKARCLPEVDVTEGRPVDSPVCSPKGLWLKSPSQRWAGGQIMTPCWPEGRWLLRVQVELLPKRQELRGPVTAEEPEAEAAAECSRAPWGRLAGHMVAPRDARTPCKGASFLPCFCRRPGAEAGKLPSEEVVLKIL